MRQFYEIYRAQPNLAPLLREISWSSHLLIMGRSQSAEEREFYLRLTIQERWSRRALQRQRSKLRSSERKILSPVKLAPAVREIHPEAGKHLQGQLRHGISGPPAAHSEDRSPPRLGASPRGSFYGSWAVTSASRQKTSSGQAPRILRTRSPPRLISFHVRHTDTKRRIDTARDILVAKSPTPSPRSKQITIALIYKFMDDHGRRGRGTRGRTLLLLRRLRPATGAGPSSCAPGWAATKTLALYAEAITKMTENPGLPPLFRDIFKNAYLPYRDPETLRPFSRSSTSSATTTASASAMPMKYLLSVLGSQGERRAVPHPRATSSISSSKSSPRKSTRPSSTPPAAPPVSLISAYKHILRGRILRPQRMKAKG